MSVVAPSQNWILIHLFGLFSYLATIGGWVALAASLWPGPGRAWGLVGLGWALAAGGAQIVWLAIDGIAVKVLVDLWALAPAAEQATAFAVARGAEEIIFALFSVNVMVFGLVFAPFGLAVLLDGGYPRLLGGLMVFAGAGLVAVGVAQAFTGRHAVVTHILLPIFVVLSAVLVLPLAWQLWRRASGAAVAGAAAAGT